MRRRAGPERLAAAGALALALALARDAAGDQLLQVPTADRVDGPTLFHVERATDGRAGYTTLLLPAGKAYELMFRRYSRFGEASRWEGGFLYQVLPDGIFTPGLSVGVWDLTNSSPLGRRAFAVLTKQLDSRRLDLPGVFERVEFTLGLGTGRFLGPLAGIRVDLPARVTLAAEFDSRLFSAGVWLSPIKPLSLRAEVQDGELYLGAELRASF